MRKYILLIGFVCMVMTGSTSYTDSIPDARIQREAKQMADRKLESLSSDRYRDMMVIQFRDLRSLIDSLYAESIKKQESIESASQARDSVTHVLLYTMAENARLQASNDQYEKDIAYALKLPTVLFLLLIMIVATLIGQGIFRGVEKYKGDKHPNL